MDLNVPSAGDMKQSIYASKLDVLLLKTCVVDHVRNFKMYTESASVAQKISTAFET